MAVNRFNKFFEYVLKVEGGYVNHKNDKGGETNYGITKAVAVANGYTGDMKSLPKATAQKIYEKKYYLAFKLDKVLSDKVSFSIFDFVVNAGRNGIKKAQEAVNLSYGKKVLEVDGAIGATTLKYINMMSTTKFLATYHKLQRDYYRAIVKNNKSQEVFLKGWLNRVAIKEEHLKKI